MYLRKTPGFVIFPRVGREPFVWEVHVRREMIEDEVARLREVSHAVWREAIGVPRVKKITGRDSREYTVTVVAEWVQRGSDHIRVTASLASPGLRRSVLRQAFVITPDNQFV